MTQNECDSALVRLDSLINQVWNDLSESDTRAKIIDPLFKEVLSWKEQDIIREPFVHSGYIDYLFCIDGVRWFLVEAKKEGLEFNIPKDMTGREYSLSGVLTTNLKVKKAIDQARQYCVDAGVKTAVVTNGRQFILFEGFKENDDWRMGTCVVFHSPQDVRDNFYLFWDILNREKVKNGSLRKYISKHGFNFKYIYRPINGLHAKGSSEPRNWLASYIQPFVDYVFIDLIDESQLDMLYKCYVFRKHDSSAVAQLDYQLDRIPNYAKKFDTRTIFESIESCGTFQEFYENSERFLNSGIPKGTMMVMMGGVGSGKTTFLHRFFNFSVNNPKTTAWFYVNFLETLPNPELIEDHIYKTIVRTFEKKYSDQFRKELEKLQINSLKADFKTVVILVSLLMRSGYTVSVILDNADQHEFRKPKYQEDVITVGKYLTEALKIITIVALREENFFKSTRSGVLTAFPTPPLHISSPRFEDLIRRRLRYVLALLEKGDDELSTLLGKDIRLGEKRQLARVYFEIVKNSLRSERPKGREILRFIDDVSGKDMRRALDFFRTFLVSGNTDVDEMLRIEAEAERTKDHYDIPVHHVVKSIILQHSTLYANKNSPVLNLFDFDPNYSDSHFTHLRILDFLHCRQSYHSIYGDGFVDIDGIMQEGNRVGISEKAIEEALIKMADFGLVEFENQSREGFKSARFVKINATGIYYLRHLAHTFQYLDMMWMDSPITNYDVVCQLLKHVVELRGEKTPHDIIERLDRTSLFLNYLKAKEEEEHKLRPEYQYSELTRKLFMPTIIKCFEETKEYILSK